MRCQQFFARRPQPPTLKRQTASRPLSSRSTGLALSLLATAILILSGLFGREAAADPARFWLTASTTSAAAPQVQTLSATGSATALLSIWVQPATVGAGPYHATTNPFRKLQNVSLNLVTDAPNIDFIDGTFTLLNPQVSGAKRFEFVYDSHTPLSQSPTPLTSAANESLLLEGTPDQLQGLQGLTIASSGYAGIGPSCLAGDSFCTVTPAGPVWLFATVGYRALHRADGLTAGFLQIGANGMNHVDAGGNAELAALTDVVFGVNSQGVTPAYNAGCAGGDCSIHRGYTAPGDDPDVLLLDAIGFSGDYDRNGQVGPEDYTLWRTSFGGPLPTDPGDGADGNGNRAIDAADYSVWRDSLPVFPGGSQLAQVSVPEPASLALLSIAGLVGIPYRFRRDCRTTNCEAPSQRMSPDKTLNQQQTILSIDTTCSP